ncbi:protein NLRC5-like isoform X3 [Acanthaster planci]|uniref:Protein NLRC5-like isoform X3 n=1 Tax=Acanthaster planci TaxID=133434 RepID=A0A8B7XTZ1_ACAPL|nr:protein NLRC5-like isoform X3 [Acanthaster planci]
MYIDVYMCFFHLCGAPIAKMPQKTIQQLDEDNKATAVVYDHSNAKLVTRRNKVRRSRKEAFLTAIPYRRSSSHHRQGGNDQPPSSLTARKSKRKLVTESVVISAKQKLLVCVRTHPLHVAKEICFELDPETPVSSLKELIHKKFGVQPKHQRLHIRENFQLCDLLTLQENGVDKDKIISLRVSTDDPGQDSPKDKSSFCEEYLQNLSLKVQSSWKELAKHLGYEDTQIAEIQSTTEGTSEASHKVLLTWWEKMTNQDEASQKLRRALETAGLTDSAQNIPVCQSGDEVQRAKPEERDEISAKKERQENGSSTTEEQKLKREHSSDTDRLHNFCIRYGKQQLQIFVRNPLLRGPKTLCFQLDPETTISSLKLSIGKKIGVQPHLQRLIIRRNWRTFQLCDLLTLNDCGVQQDENILLRLSTDGLLGGGKKGPVHTEEKNSESSNTHSEQDPERPVDTPAMPQQDAQAPSTSSASAEQVGSGYLLRLARKLREEWKYLAINLGFSPDDIETFVRNDGEDSPQQKFKMLEAWWEKQDNPEKAVQNLRGALQEAGRADLASKIPGMHATKHQLGKEPDKHPGSSDLCQDIGSKLRNILKKLYMSTGSYVQLISKVDDQMHTVGYATVQLRTREKVPDPLGKCQERVQIINSTDYAKIFRQNTETGNLIKRLIFVGHDGIGKSTIFDKIAYDWAEGMSEELQKFKLVISLKMCAVDQTSDLDDVVVDQLLDKDSGISKENIDQFILENSNEVLILLDGFDEMSSRSLDPVKFGSILKALNRTKYRDCFICVSTRPSYLDILKSESLVQYHGKDFEVVGFEQNDVKEYARKYHQNTPGDAEAFIKTIYNSSTLRDLAKIPMLLLLMCLLWEENKQLPETMSRLYTEAVDNMFRRKANVSGKDVKKALIAIGKTALHGLQAADRKFSFRDNEFEQNALGLAIKAGIVNRQRVYRKQKYHTSIQFIHRTMQEYCAAKYLQDLNRRVFKKTRCKSILKGLCSTMDGVVSSEYLFRFCCGDNEGCMVTIVKLLERSTNAYHNQPNFQSNVVQAISRGCFFESQSSKAPEWLTSDFTIPPCIDVRNSVDSCSFKYLFEVICTSNNNTEQLSNLKSVFVSDVSSVRGLITALGYMKNLTDLQLTECYLENGVLKNMMMALKDNKTLTKLCINGNDTSGGVAEEWAPHIKRLTGLKILEIVSCGLTNLDMKHIASSVSGMPSLQTLILAGNTALGGSADSWSSYLPQMTRVKTLNLSNCSLQSTDIEHIAVCISDMFEMNNLILSDNRTLSRSVKSWSNYLQRMTHVKTLNLSNCSLEWTDVEHIILSAREMPRLSSVFLEGNLALRDGPGHLWGRYFPEMTLVQAMNLEDCSMGWIDLELVASPAHKLPHLILLQDGHDHESYMVTFLVKGGEQSHTMGKMVFVKMYRCI